MRIRSIFGLVAGSGAAATVTGCAADPTAPIEELKPSPSVALSDLRVESRPLGDVIVFARFPDLNADATTARLEALRKDKELSANLTSLTGALAKEGITAQEIEGLVLRFVKGQKVDEANVSLAAIMRDQYDAQLRTAFLDRKLDVPDVLRAMISRNTVLTKAAFGATPPLSRLTRR
jgi:hypothetical protein